MLNEIKSIPERGTKVITVLMMSLSCPEGATYLTHKLVKMSKNWVNKVKPFITGGDSNDEKALLFILDPKDRL